MPKAYNITSELGEIKTQCHIIESGPSGKTVYNSGQRFFEATSSRESFKSNRYKELALDFASDMSTREASKRLNRIRLEAKGVIATTYRNLVEREGDLMQAHLMEKCEEMLVQNGFTSDGELEADSPYSAAPSATIPESAIEDSAIKLNQWEYSASDYELPESAVNVSIDEVCVKRQTATRPKDETQEQPKRVDNTVIHVEFKRKSYILNSSNIISGLKLLIGLLLHNGLLDKQIVIFADGAKTIHNAIFKMLSFANCKIILDWYHLEKKCKEILSMALAGSKIRNEFLTELLPCLWFGNVDGAIKKLQAIEAKKIKNSERITQLIDYLLRVKPYIPCYALRKELGLRNSSNRGEKSNDIVVANRQKHNGMSWSNAGSTAFASIVTAAHNKELERWIHQRNINFLLNDDAA